MNSMPLKSAMPSALKSKKLGILHMATVMLSLLVMGKAVVEIFPESRAARITTENARVELFRIPGIAINADDGRVAFDHGTNDNQSRVIVRATEQVHLNPFKKPETLFDTAASSSTSPAGVQ